MPTKSISGRKGKLGGTGSLLGRTRLNPEQRAHSYLLKYTCTIDHTQVGGVDQSNFIAVVFVTKASFATVPNGGSIYNLDNFNQPADFTVSLNSDGSNPLDFTIPEYDPTNGYMELWVRLPNVSSTVDTVFYIVFSDPYQTAWQGSAHFGGHPEYDLNYAAAYHLHGGAAVDNTGNYAHGLPSGPTLTTGVVGTALAFAGGTDVVDVSLAISGFAFPAFSYPMTFEFWAKLPATQPGGGQALLQSATLSGSFFLIYTIGDVFGHGFPVMDLYTSGGESGIQIPTDNAWHHYVIAVDSSGNLIATLDGVLQTTVVTTAGALTPSTSTAIKMGNGGAPFTGSLDEVRFSKIDRISSSDYSYAVACYNNQKSGSTFITLTGPTTAGSVIYTLGATFGSYSLTGQNTNLLATRLLIAAQGSYTLTGQTTKLLKGYYVAVSQGSYVLTGQAAILKATRLITVAQGSYTLNGQVARLLKGYYINAAQGSYTLTGENVNLLHGYLVKALQGTYAITGQTANLISARILRAAFGSYTLSGQAANLLYSKRLVAAQGSYVLTGEVANLLRQYTLLASQGSYTLTGQAARLIRLYTLIASQGSYNLTGQNVNLIATRLINAAQGSYILTGEAANLLYSRLLNAAQGTYTLTGEDVILTILSNPVIILDTGSYNLTGQNVNLLISRYINAQQGSYTLSGQNANLLTGKSILAQQGTYVLSGQDARLLIGRLLLASQGMYTLTGEDVSLINSLSENSLISLAGQFYPSSDYY